MSSTDQPRCHRRINQHVIDESTNMSSTDQTTCHRERERVTRVEGRPASPRPGPSLPLAMTWWSVAMTWGTILLMLAILATSTFADEVADSRKLSREALDAYKAKNYAL